MHTHAGSEFDKAYIPREQFPRSILVTRRMPLSTCPFVESFFKLHKHHRHYLLRTCLQHARPSWHVVMVWKSLVSSSDTHTRLLWRNCSRKI